ncbi:MAG: universal stress protein UspE [Colwellia sp.]
MKDYRNILVIIDPDSSQQKALQRAIELVNKLISSQNLSAQDITLTAFCSIYDFSYDMTTFLSPDERVLMRDSVVKSQRKQLESVIKAYPSQVEIKVDVTWHNRSFEAILEKVSTLDCDLVIKETHQHPKLQSLIFTPTDWHLLRKCPCPLLLVKDHKWPENGNVIAAVHTTSDEAEHLNLNKQITHLAQGFSSIMDGQTHLVNAYPGTPVNITIEIPEFNVTEFNDTMKKHHDNGMLKHAQAFNIESKNTHVVEGLPEDVISQCAQDLDAELVVLGTIGRVGLSGALIGNTAEHVVDLLQCDILAVSHKD